MNDGAIWSQKEHNNWYVLQCDCFWLVTTVWAWCGLFLLLLLFCLFSEVKNSQQHNSGGLLLKEQVCLLQKQTYKKQSTIFFFCFGYSHIHTYTYLYSTFILFSSYHKFSILLNDTLTYRVEEQGSDSQTLVDNPLCLLVSNTYFHWYDTDTSLSGSVIIYSFW